MEVRLDELLGPGTRFRELRAEQKELLTRLMKSAYRADVVAAPTGVGKSLLAVVYAKLVGMRAVILTSTRALQDQYHRDFQTVKGVTDIKGMSNYPCRELGGAYQCDVGPCLEGGACSWREVGCAYYDRTKVAREADIVVTNYSYWFAHRFDGALGQRDIVICDEAHELDAELARATGIDLRSNEVDFERGAEDWDQERWRKWAEAKLQLAAKALARALAPDDKRRLKSLVDRLQRLAWFRETLIWDYVPGRLVRFEALDLKPYLEGWLLRHAPKAVLMSATVKPYMVEALGFEDVGYMETGSPFPVDHRPLIWYGTGIRLNARMSERNFRFWLDKLDQVIDLRLDRKGIVHSVSYSRAKQIKKQSRHGKHMIIHDSGQAIQTISRFKKARPPAILVSPSVHTGHDFPYDEAAWQIIAKVPFPDTRSGIARARQEEDGQWNVKFAARTIVQMAGRVVRAADDLGETIILDDNWKWLLSRFKPLFPRWLREAFRTSATVPKPWWKED